MRNPYQPPTDDMPAPTCGLAIYRDARFSDRFSADVPAPLRRLLGASDEPVCSTDETVELIETPEIIEAVDHSVLFGGVHDDVLSVDDLQDFEPAFMDIAIDPIVGQITPQIEPVVTDDVFEAEWFDVVDRPLAA